MQKRLICQNDILESFAIFVPNSSLVKMNSSERANYGEAEIKNIVNFYASGPFKIDKDDILNEWDEFKVPTYYVISICIR